MSKTVTQQNIKKTSGIFISLSREHGKYAEEIENCFKDSNVSVKADFMRFSKEDLPMQILILLSSSIAGGVIYDLLKVGVQRVFNKFKKARVSVRDNNGIIYNINQKGKINILVVPNRAKKFAHIKNVDDLIYHLQDQKTKNDWQEVKLGDVVDSANTGLDAIKRAPIVDYDSGIKCLRIQDISQRKKFTNWGYCEVDNKNYERFKIKKYDIFIARTGASIGVNKYIQKELPAVYNNGLIRLRADKDKCISKYIYYNLRSKKYNGFIEGISGGTSTQPNMQINALLSFELNLPPLPEQKAIAEVLSSLDNKIDLLHRQNKTLENMAQALFRKWFVEEADEKWEKKLLGEVVNITIGRTPPRKEFQWFSKNSKDWKWISIKDMGESGVYIFNTSEYLTQEAVEKFNIPIIPKDTVILSFKMTVGRLAITTEKMLSNEAIAQFKFNNQTPFSKEYSYLFLRKFNFDSLGSTSSIVTSINSAMIKEILIAIPDNKTMNKFQKASKPLFEKMFFNQSQIRTLENLRDVLLPKLMSGVVSVRF